MALRRSQDAYGHAVLDYLRGRGRGWEIVERDDGLIDVSGGQKIHLSEHKDWPPEERKAMRYARGRVLDIGCGAGRHALYLQREGLDVLGIDISPLAITVCRRRGLKHARVLSITQIGPRLGAFDTILMLGNNFGLFGSFKRARWLLRRFTGITNEGARIIAQTIDPYQTSNPDHLAYHRWNRRRGRMGGQVRLRVRYRKHVTPWLDYLFVSRAEMTNILRGTGWRVRRFISSKGPGYIAIIEKKLQSPSP